MPPGACNTSCCKDSQPLSGNVQLDDAYSGGERRGGKRGRGASGKTPFVATVQTTNEGRPIVMRWSKITVFRKTEIAAWAQRHLHASNLVVSDSPRAPHRHRDGWMQAGEAIVTGGGPASVENEPFTRVNTLIGNVKNSIPGTCDGISGQHMPRHLAEFCYRFNRRFELLIMIPRIGYTSRLVTPDARAAPEIG
jgi:hypothetical protein